jgi:hypothetical protein
MTNLRTLKPRQIAALSYGELHAILFQMDTAPFFDAGRYLKDRRLRDKIIAAIEKR